MVSGDEFVGEHSHSLDTKGRVIFPARMREPLGSQVVLRKGIERCVYVYPLSEWDKEVDQVNTLPKTDPDARAYVRFFFSQASRESVDKQGRLTVPQSFREYAGLDREVVVVGAGTRVEIWDRGAWDSQRTDVESRVDEFSRRLGI